jgi:hypothetical protein
MKNNIGMKRTKVYIRTNVTVLLIFLLAGISCNKKATDYRQYLNQGESVYPGVVSGVSVRPGNGRLMLVWNPSPDPSIVRYVVYYNNFSDSLVVNANSHSANDTVKTVISHLSEYSYAFYITSIDGKGNRSITTTVNNARVYGPIYQSTLHNRLPDPATPYVVNADNSVTLHFATPDTINVATYINYTNAAGQAGQVVLPGDSSTVTLPSYAHGGAVLYQSSYVPVRLAIDTFSTLKADTFPSIFRLVQCDKSLFQQMTLSGDAGVYQSSTSVSMLWDGSVGPQPYPNIYHSDGTNLPSAFSFDMGKVYNDLAVVEETGRSCCHNPDHFEVWGIADTTGASPGVPTQDPGWAAAMRSLGWVMLVEGFRGDDGSAPMKFNFIANPPPVRFIRFRTLHTADGATNAVNMSELTFWDKQ